MNQESLKDEIKDFAKRNANKMIRTSSAQVVDSFRDQAYLLSARSVMSSYGTVIVEVRARPWISSFLAINGGTPDMSRKTKTARTEFDDKFTIEELLEKMLTALFYDINGLMPEPEAL